MVEEKNSPIVDNLIRKNLQCYIVICIWYTEQKHNPMSRNEMEEAQNSFGDKLWQNSLIYSGCRIIRIDIIILEVGQAHKLQYDIIRHHFPHNIKEMKR